MNILEFLLQNYYGLANTKLKENKDYIEIIKDEKEYLLLKNIPYSEVEKSNNLSQMVDYSDTIIKNLFGNAVTTYNSMNYVLLSTKNHVELEKQINKLYPIEELITLNWRKLWIEISNSIEEYYKKIQGKYPLIDNSIPYYIGLLEMSIYLLKDYKEYYDIGYIQHRIIDEESYCNPFNLIVDIKERDFAEYIKFIFYNNKYQEIDLIDLIEKGRHTYQYDLIIARLIFPNYYFHIVNEIIDKKKEESSIKDIITRNDEYINYVKTIIEEINKVYPIKKYPLL